MRINVGCGQTPTKNWKNFDNSVSLRLSRFSLLPNLLLRVGLLNKEQYDFVDFARANRIEYGDATKGLPVPDDSVEVVYSSHMLEHLDRRDALVFLKEVKRVLRADGILRLAVPDLNKLATRYVETANADEFVAATKLAFADPKSLSGRLRLLLVGVRHHKWMYDGPSLCSLLRETGFSDPKIVDAGSSSIRDVDLNLSERADISVYVEARKQASGAAS